MANLPGPGRILKNEAPGRRGRIPVDGYFFYRIVEHWQREIHRIRSAMMCSGSARCSDGAADIAGSHVRLSTGVDAKYV